MINELISIMNFELDKLEGEEGIQKVIVIIFQEKNMLAIVKSFRSCYSLVEKSISNIDMFCIYSCIFELNYIKDKWL